MAIETLLGLAATWKLNILSGYLGRSFTPSTTVRIRFIDRKAPILLAQGFHFVPASFNISILVHSEIAAPSSRKENTQGASSRVSLWIFVHSRLQHSIRRVWSAERGLIMKLWCAVELFANTGRSGRKVKQLVLSCEWRNAMASARKRLPSYVAPITTSKCMVHNLRISTGDKLHGQPTVCAW